jgi:hypothetical protein
MNIIIVRLCWRLLDVLLIACVEKLKVEGDLIFRSDMDKNIDERFK